MKTPEQFLEELKVWLKEKSDEASYHNEDWFSGKELAFDETIEKIEQFQREQKANENK